MKKIIWVSLFVIVNTSCGILLEPIVKPINNMLEEYHVEGKLDSCELNLIQLIISKRIFENEFPKDYTDLYSYDYKSIHDSLLNIQEFSKDLNGVITNPWNDVCISKFDTVVFKHYNQDSINIVWTKHKNLNGNTKKYRESWNVTYLPDSLLRTTIVGLNIELVDSKGNVIYEGQLHENKENAVAKKLR
ncbi:hypothetical protein KDU71_03035 [Carboxylicivirga sediminis]|uniref:Uncharacterized protein n=1 Tax=Carboxylicivirga sediminis TaxID=2006564 RepID=A0A941F169_9BACT|nr:hypothetical protein [Carboxylicivirga sediminis]MBR8534519.1 hypothetical protein [Carboxylicivirga sediminis]